MILDNICDKRKEQLERDISIISRQDIKYMAAEKEYQTVSFSKSIKRDTLSVISEVKKASPSKGLICPDFDPVKTACEYEKNGANAISCGRALFSRLCGISQSYKSGCESAYTPQGFYHRRISALRGKSLRC